MSDDIALRMLEMSEEADTAEEQDEIARLRRRLDGIAPRELLASVGRQMKARDENASRYPDAWQPSVEQHGRDALRVTGDCGRYPCLRIAALAWAAWWLIGKEEPERS